MTSMSFAPGENTHEFPPVQDADAMVLQQTLEENPSDELRFYGIPASEFPTRHHALAVATGEDEETVFSRRFMRAAHECACGFGHDVDPDDFAVLMRVFEPGKQSSNQYLRQSCYDEKVFPSMKDKEMRPLPAKFTTNKQLDRRQSRADRKAETHDKPESKGKVALATTVDYSEKSGIWISMNGRWEFVK